MIDLVIGAVLVLGPSAAAWFAGHRVGRAAEQRRAGAPPVLMCTCGHGFGTHAGAGTCSGATKRLLMSNDYGRTEEWTWAACGCHGYDGPEPLPRVWTALDLLPPDEVRRIEAG